MAGPRMTIATIAVIKPRPIAPAGLARANLANAAQKRLVATMLPAAAEEVYDPTT